MHLSTVQTNVEFQYGYCQCCQKENIQCDLVETTPSRCSRCHYLNLFCVLSIADTRGSLVPKNNRNVLPTLSEPTDKDQQQTTNSASHENSRRVEQDYNQQQKMIVSNLESPMSVSNCHPQKGLGLISGFEAERASTAVSTIFWPQGDQLNSFQYHCTTLGRQSQSTSPKDVSFVIRPSKKCGIRKPEDAIPSNSQSLPPLLPRLPEKAGKELSDSDRASVKTIDLGLDKISPPALREFYRSQLKTLKEETSLQLLIKWIDVAGKPKRKKPIGWPGSGKYKKPEMLEDCERKEIIFNIIHDTGNAVSAKFYKALKTAAIDANDRHTLLRSMVIRKIESIKRPRFSSTNKRVAKASSRSKTLVKGNPRRSICDHCSGEFYSPQNVKRHMRNSCPKLVYDP